MAVSLIRHRVNDYDAFRMVYDSAGPMQKAGGVTAESVHRLVGDPNDILVIHHFDSLAAAQTFFSNPELKNAMQRGGVIGEPLIEFFE